MNNISTDSVVEQNTSLTDFPVPLLPASLWNSQLTYLRLVFKAKKALDRIEKEVGVVRSES